MSAKSLLLRLLALLLLVIAVASQATGPRQHYAGQQLRLPNGYNMRLGPLPTRLVGKGAYTVPKKRTPLGPNLPANDKHNRLQQHQLQQQQLQQQQFQQQQLQQQHQRLQLQRLQHAHWATAGGKRQP